MATEIKKIISRRDTSANWQSNNPILANGEIAIDTTNRVMKIGDGVTPWNSLKSYDERLIQAIGSDAYTYKLHVSSAAFSTSRVDIAEGNTIVSLGGYNSGEIILSSSVNFDGETARVSYTKLPFTLPFRVQALRATVDVDTDITVSSPSRGAIRDIRELEARADALEEDIEELVGKVADIDKIGTESGDYSLHISAGLFSNVEVDIPAGDTILGFGGYKGDILLCPERPFNLNNYVRIGAGALPYVLPFDVLTLRPSADIDADLQMYGNGSGILGRLEELERRYEGEKPSAPIARGAMTDGTVLSIAKNSVKCGDTFAFNAAVGTFNALRIGRGRPQDKKYASVWVEIDATDVKVYTYYTSESVKSYAHGLTIAENIGVLLHVGMDGKAKLILSSGGQTYSVNVGWDGCNGVLFAESVGSTLDATFSWYAKGLDSPVWLFGDSYFSVTSPARWTSHLLTEGYTDILLNGYPGCNSSNAIADLEGLLAYARPRYIVWCLGMNDNDSGDIVNAAWQSAVSRLLDLCERYGITPILSTTPTARGGYVEDSGDYNMRVNKYKNAVVRESGHRYIDFDKAVGADEATGEWYTDMLSTDGVHPTQRGAVALFMQAMADCPELAGR